MRKTLAAVLGAALVVAVPATATAAPENGKGSPGAAAPAPGASGDHRRDDKSSPLSDKQRELRQKAAEQVVQGERTPLGDNKDV